MRTARQTSVPRRLLSATGVASTVVLTALAGGCGGDSGSSSGGLSLVHSGTITWCADISAPPLSYYDEDQKPVGAEVELGDAMAKSMGLRSEWKNIAFSGIIPALQGHQCDAILSQLYIKPERLEVVDFVPYMYAGNTVLVPQGNPEGINGLEDLCGHKVATETGTTSVDYLDQTSVTCKDAGEPEVAISKFAHDSEAQQQLKLGLVDAYATTVETAGYAVTTNPDLYETIGEPFGRITCGIATTKDATELHDALQKALTAVRDDGTYDDILADWSLTGDNLPADDAAEATASVAASVSPSS